MTKSLALWMLGGALAASLSWNWKQVERPADEQSCASAASCCSIESAGLALDEEQQQELARLCRRSCAEADRLDRRADELQRELRSSLGRPELDEEAARALVREIGELRERSLEACVGGLLEVRGLLTPEQVAAMLAQCESAAARRGGASCPDGPDDSGGPSSCTGGGE